MTSSDQPLAVDARLEELFRQAGWQLTDEFNRQYLTDAWTYNLANLLLAQDRVLLQARAALEASADALSECQKVMLTVKGSLTEPYVIFPLPAKNEEDE